jgi:predicted  nucleic acid-binding Zn-ribbon protein
MSATLDTIAHDRAQPCAVRRVAQAAIVELEELRPLPAEVDALKEQLAQAESDRDEVSGRYTRSEIERERLRKWIEEHGQHPANCRYYDAALKRDCDCGLTAILAEAGR